MGRNKFSQKEIDKISWLLAQKCSVSRFRQKQIRHVLRVVYGFHISDFGVQGKAFGPEDLQDCIKRGRIVILDDSTIEAMKAKRARDKERDLQSNAVTTKENETIDWREVLKQWEEENGKTE